MPALTKAQGHACPCCGQMPAETKHMHEAFTRWKCSCGAEGRVAQAAAKPDAPTVHKHWRDVARGA